MDCIIEGERTIAGARVPVVESDDERFMLRAIEIAEGGRGRTGPNPLVGAVIVYGGEVVGEGFHEKVGESHAEVNALRQAGERARGSTVYVTLEPCNHHGRTPPCTEALLEAGVERVVMAIRDPNREVEGGGKERLEQAGVSVEVGPLRALAERQNEAYVKKVKTGLPFVTLKMAMTVDGKVATRTGDSKWISSDEARSEVHLMRSWSDAVMVGIGTVLADDPRLTVRMGFKADPSPLRVVVDGRSRTPTSSKVADVTEAPTLVAVAGGAPAERVRALERNGVEVHEIGHGAVELGALMELLGRRGVTALLVEGGPGLAGSLLDRGLIDKFVFYVAPKVVGGAASPGPFGGAGAASVAEAVSLRIDTVSTIGPDIRLVAYPG
jgi:diaminohydroxyphosphoribosylaminopyrimidine deaminase/5-amino-6-(5-phosphoribosylamino)uracil reductase